MPGKIPFSTREKRSKRLLSLSDNKHAEFCKLNVGKITDVLFEHKRSEGMITGFTENYLRAEHPWNANLAGRVEKVILTGVSVSGNMNTELVK
jgi:threonylcarbamoyladenosine tRNA methylthiotransferase MtaB